MRGKKASLSTTTSTTTTTTTRRTTTTATMRTRRSFRRRRLGALVAVAATTTVLAILTAAGNYYRVSVVLTFQQNYFSGDEEDNHDATTTTTTALSSWFLLPPPPALHRAIKNRTADTTRGDVSYDEQQTGMLVPKELLQLQVYSVKRDFVNEIGRVPAFWGQRRTTTTTTTTTRANAAVAVREYGPCVLDAELGGHDFWTREAERNRERERNGDGPAYRPFPAERNGKRRAEESTLKKSSNFCRPGFLIIGAGKCGTTSLYQYLVGHSRVLPASEKQIHYFRYFYDRPIEFYHGHFPTAQSFLGSGALATGEASPGYLPYPEAAPRVAETYLSAAADSAGRSGASPRIVAIGRDPLERAYSSYRYNYVNTTVEMMHKGRFRGRPYNIPAGKSVEYYEKHLFSFEDLVRVELKLLKECLVSTNRGAEETRKKYGSFDWARRAYGYYASGDKEAPSLVDVIGVCYGKKLDGGSRAADYTVLIPQWVDLTERYPYKVFPKKRHHVCS